MPEVASSISRYGIAAAWWSPLLSIDRVARRCTPRRRAPSPAQPGSPPTWTPRTSMMPAATIADAGHLERRRPGRTSRRRRRPGRGRGRRRGRSGRRPTGRSAGRPRPGARSRPARRPPRPPMYGTADHSTCHVSAATGAKTTTPNRMAAAPAPSGSPARAMRMFQPACSAAAARASARAVAGTASTLPGAHARYQCSRAAPSRGRRPRGGGRRRARAARRELDREGAQAGEARPDPLRRRPARASGGHRRQPDHRRVEAAGRRRSSPTSRPAACAGGTRS